MPKQRAAVTLTAEQSILVGKLFRARDELNALFEALPESGLGVVAELEGLPQAYWPRLQLRPCVVFYEDEGR
jgi:hypothetical protein